MKEKPKDEQAPCKSTDEFIPSTDPQKCLNPGERKFDSPEQQAQGCAC